MSMPLTLSLGKKPPTTFESARRLATMAVLWGAAFAANIYLWDLLLERLVGADSENRTADALHFFVKDSIQLLLLLVGMIYAIALVRTALSPERIREALSGKTLIVSLLLATALGAVTPFCTCSSVPLFIGFVAAGVPLSISLTFLIASPLINEVAVVVLADRFGWEVTGIYVGAGVALAVGAGLVISRLSLDDQVQDFVKTSVPPATIGRLKPTLHSRMTFARKETKDIFSRVWIWILVGVAIGAFIHGWVPDAFFTSLGDGGEFWSVPLATIAGAPLYSGAVGAIPVAEALWSKGVPLGTAMSFMMATVALSLPEFIMLRRVMKAKLLTIFVGILLTGIMVVGLTMNLAT